MTNEKTKKPKPKDTQLDTLRIFTFFWKTRQRSSSPGVSAARVTYVYENTPQNLAHLPPKSYHNFMIQGRVQLKYINHVVKVGIEATY